MNSRASLQTAKFNEPVTLDFLDAELENEIKVEVRNLTRLVYFSTFFFFFLQFLECFSAPVDKEADD